MAAVQETVDRVRRIDVDQYRYGFETLIESDKAPKGLSEDTVRFISAKKNEPAWMLEWRLEAYRRWLTMTEPTWARVNYPKINYQDYYYYSAPKRKALASLDEVDPEILKTYENPDDSRSSALDAPAWATATRDFQEAAAQRGAPRGWSARADFTKGQELLSLGRLEEAEALFKKSQATDPQFALPWLGLSATLLRQKKT